MNTDGTNKKLISNDSAHLMVINNGWLYYINDSDGDKLYKVKVDGTSRTKLTDIATQHLDIEGDFIYYIPRSSDYKGIYKIKKDGTMNTKLTDQKAYYIRAYKDSIYFTENDCGPNSIHKLNIDGTGLKTLPLTDVSCFTIYDNIIFSVHIDGVIQLYKLDVEKKLPYRLPM